MDDTSTTPVATPAPDDTAAAAAPAPTAPASDPASVQAQIAPFQQKEQEAYQKASDLANPPAAPAPGPHARLLSMVKGLVQGLAIGADAFATSEATGGKEGGVQEVLKVRQEQQQQKIQAQQAATAQRNQQIQQQLMVGDTNHKLAQNIILLATLPNELAKSDLEVKGAQQAQAITGADFQAAHGGMTPQEFSTALSGTAPANGGQGGTASSFFTTTATQQLGAAQKILGSDDPYVQKLQTVLSDPKATPKDLWTATNQVQNQVGLQEKATEAQTKREAAASNSPVGKLSTPEALVAPGAVEAINAKIKDPSTDPKDVPRLQALIPLAQAAQEHKIALDRQQKQMEQDVQAGDPAVIGQEMASGLVAPSQVLSARSMSRPFYSKVLSAANDASMKATGKPFDATQAEAQYKYALNPQTQNTLNMVDSLEKPGGVADILLEKGKALPTVGVPKFNSWEQALSYQTGGKEVPAYMPAAVDFADMYSKIMGGGVGSDSARLQALNLVLAAQNAPQRAASVETLKDTLKQRGGSMVRDNPTLNAMYPNLTQKVKASNFARPANVSANAKLMQAPGGQPHWIEPQNQAAAKNAGAVEIQ